MQHTDEVANAAPAGPGRHRARTRFSKLHAIGLAGLAVLGVGLTAGTASADPTAQDWAKIRQCESGGNYSINTGNGYYGAYQFDLGTWRSMGGSGRPSDASPAEQDARALALWRSRGWGPWACASLVSLSDGTAPPQSTAPVRPAPPKKVSAPPYARIAAGTATRWTEHLFRTVLGRGGGGNNPFAIALNRGQANYAGVSTSVVMSRERLNRLVADGYARCLNRRPDTGGLNSYAPWLKNNSLSALYVKLCGSTEAFNKAGRNLNRWVDNMYVQLLNRHASAGEQRTWANYAVHYGRGATINGIVNSVAWRSIQLDRLYMQMLGRHADSTGQKSYAASMSNRGVFTVAVALAKSSEFARRA